MPLTRDARVAPPPADTQALRSLARLLDASFGVPGTRWRFGLDALLGLLPGVGDLGGALLSSYIVLQGARAGASRWVLLRMALNVVVETVIGAVPVLGDLFDLVWKANLRNVRLLEEHLASPGHVERASRGWVFAVALGLVALVVGVGVLAVWLGLALWSALRGALG